jgi:hypothetical protein
MTRSGTSAPPAADDRSSARRPQRGHGARPSGTAALHQGHAAMKAMIPRISFASRAGDE